MRVGVLGLMHESNTFLPTPTVFEDFASNILATGEGMRTRLADSHHEVGGFFEGLERERLEAVPLFFAWATPGGTVRADALERLLGMMFAQLDAALSSARGGGLDGLLVAPHGAGVSEAHRDMDGHWLARLRQRVGSSLPIVCTLDAHANVSPRMLEAVNATIVYRSNPHLDQRQRGLEAARLLGRTLRGEVRPTQGGAFPPVAINIERQYTPAPPCAPMYELADAMLQRPGVLSDSVVLGFPYADVEEMGSGFIVVTDHDAALARRLADELAGYLVAHRHEFRGELLEIDEALRRATARPGPVCLLDMGDNVGGGSPGDGTTLAHALDCCAGARSFICLYDPAAQERARAAGVGAQLELSMGGRTDALHGEPFKASVVVKALHDGRFTEREVRHSGLREFDMGPTAIVETERELTLQLTSRRTFPVSLNQLICCGLEPAKFQVLVAKGVHAPVAAYAPVCRELIRVNTPGVTSADLSRFTYRHRRRPLFPFEELDHAQAR